MIKIELSKEYILLFNTLTDTAQALARLRTELMLAQQQAEEGGIRFFSRLADGVPQKGAVLREKAGVLPQKGLERIKEGRHG